MTALPGLEAKLSLLAQNRPAVYGLVAVGTSLMAGILLTCAEQLIRFVWRRQTPNAQEGNGACHPRGGPADPPRCHWSQALAPAVKEPHR